MGLAPFEETFIREIKQSVRTSGEFRRAVSDGLTQFMGESPAQIFAMGISEAGYRNPKQFVREVSKVFGQGAAGMYSAILSTAGDPEWVSAGQVTDQLRAREGGLGSDEVGRLYESERTVYMHDQRDPDDFSEEDPH